MPPPGSVRASPPRLAPGGQVGQELLLLLLGAVVGEHVGEDVVGADGPAEAHQPLAELFENVGEGGVVQPHPAVFLGHGDAEQAQFLHLVDQVMGDPVFPVQLAGHRLHFPAHEVAHQADDLGPGLF